MNDSSQPYDICVIGGGINGVGIAADASGRGLSVILCEQNDLASATSSMSSKLIHGGLRYLEYFEFRLVHEALKEREILLKVAPHLIKPLEFVLPHDQTQRPFMILRLGLWLYDHLYWKNSLPHSKTIKLKHDIRGNPLQHHFKKALSYYDCKVDDARLVIENALQAKKYGANILTQHEIKSVIRNSDHWDIKVFSKKDAKNFNIKAKILVNTSGPWIPSLIQSLKISSLYESRLVKGSHIVVKKFYPGKHAYILQNKDRRVIFTLPFLENYLLIGTTDVAVEENFSDLEVTQEEINYLCHTINYYFNTSLDSSDVVWKFWGVRSLFNESEKSASAVTRDYKLEFQNPASQAPLLNVFGGKITTYRALAQHAVNLFKPFFPQQKGPWTANTPLPGAEFYNSTLSDYKEQFSSTYRFLPSTLLDRYFSTYGSRVHELLKNIHQLDDLGKFLTADLSEKEIEFLVKHEWAKTSDDILFRRTKLGFLLTDNQQQLIQDYLDLNF